MALFPTLKTGATAQYPLRVTLSGRVDIVWFLDGSEQRMRNAPSFLHTWEIALEQLDEQELRSIEEFLLANEGSAETFAFTDPVSQQVYPNCSIQSDSIDLTSIAPLSGKATVTIRENRI